MVVCLACFERAHEEDITGFASNLISSIPAQNFSKRFFDMLMKVFKVVNTGREIREYRVKYTICILVQ